MVNSQERDVEDLDAHDSIGRLCYSRRASPWLLHPCWSLRPRWSETCQPRRGEGLRCARRKTWVLMTSLSGAPAAALCAAAEHAPGELVWRFDFDPLVWGKSVNNY